ncbi:MAG: APC family permease, partial [Gammaproteobacteria bacterium]|nr:APC family permease [Gammaproteobacteria bacterium]
AFTYAELSARFPLSAGEAVYVQKGLGIRPLAAIVGLLIVLAGIVSSATILRGFAAYLQVFVALPEGIILPVAVIILGGLAAWGITQSVLVAALLTLIEIAGLVLIIWIGLPELTASTDKVLAAVKLAEINVLPGIMVGAFLAFFAFIGFEDMVNVAEEVRQPERNLPRAILLALAISTLLYFAVSLVSVASVPLDLLGDSEAPLALIYQQVTGREPVLITIIGMLAVINGVLIQIIMASRMAYGMARKQWLPPVFGRINARTRTPLNSTLVISVLVLLMALWAQTETLAKATSFFLLTVFALANLSLWRLKRRGDQPADIINVPAWVPITGFFASSAFFLIQAAIEFTS